MMKVTLTKEQQSQFDKLETVSSKIRFLDSLKYDRGGIAKYLNKRYQHVRNVLTQPLKKKQVA